jgi:uncharacterized protein YndB with AHSA1/START domain
MIDIMREIDAIRRSVRRDEESVSVAIDRTYPTSVEDVWEAITTPERIARWFAPISGDLREGGEFQVEGNANGQILKCDKPNLLRMTYGAPNSIVEIRLVPDGDSTTLEVEHTVPLEIARNGSGAMWVGPGWDGGFLALGQYLRGEAPEDPVAAEGSVERQQFNAKSVHAWAEAARLSGTATEEEIAAGIQVTLQQFAPSRAEHGQ